MNHGEVLGSDSDIAVADVAAGEASAMDEIAVSHRELPSPEVTGFAAYPLPFVLDR